VPREPEGDRDFGPDFDFDFDFPISMKMARSPNQAMILPETQTMPMTRREFHAGLVALLTAAVIPGARAEDGLVEGRDWRPLAPPQPGTDNATIEVLEFFSYGCPHCGSLNPLIKAWAEQLPDDVSFQRVPVTFGRAAWANLARLYFALELGGSLAELDQAVFDAVIQDRVNLYTEKNILKWIEQQGRDAEAFGKTLNSFEVDLALRRAQDLESRMRVDAVPQIVVDGRYVVVGEGVRGYEGLLRIADILVERARGERG
jgi:protein dithiol oxidoreductase (disulfide-forming)